MVADSLEKLLVKPGEAVSDVRSGRMTPAFRKKWNRLVETIEGGKKIRGKGVRLSEQTDGVIYSFDPHGGGGVPSEIAFPCTVDSDNDDALLSFGFGTIGGFEPKIDKRLIATRDEKDPADTEPPQLRVKPDAFDAKYKRSRIYFRVENDKTWTPQGVTIIASAQIPAKESYVHFKLAGLLENQDGDFNYRQATWHNLSYATSERRGPSARAWFYV